MSRWRPALRMARRDLRRHPVRAVLTCLLVALPVFAAVVAAQVSVNDRWSAERYAEATFYDGDAILTVSPYSAIRPRAALRGDPRPTPGAVERDPATVDLAGMLPAGTRIAPMPEYSNVTLTTGGTATAVRVDLDEPLTSTVARIGAGRAPQAPDEVAMPEVTARELGLLDESGRPKDGAVLNLVGGHRLSLVGVIDTSRSAWDESTQFVVPPDSVLPREDEDADPTRVVALPAASLAQNKATVEELAAVGVSMVPRDTMLHPEAWGMEAYDSSLIDLTPLLVGALCILVGLVEVVLLVGAAFAIAARRQVRDLGLLASNGGTGADLRRVLLAQGLVLGVLSSAVGATLGVVAFSTLAPRIAPAVGRALWRYDIDWVSVIAIAVLGSLTSVVAALLPAWQAGRLTPLQSLSGRFPIRPGESRAHRPAFVLAGLGLVTVLAGGWMTSTAQAHHPRWLGLAVSVAAGGLLLLIVGTVWSTPYVVRRVSALSRVLPLSGRYAFRDAGRHRFRTAAAVTALTITVGGVVLTGFGLTAAARNSESHDTLGPRMIQISLDEGRSLDQAATAASTIQRIADPAEIVTTSLAGSSADPDEMTTLGRVGEQLHIVDEESLGRIVELDDASLRTFRDGGVLTTQRRAVRDDRVRLVTRNDDRRTGAREVPAAQVERRADWRAYSGTAFISPATAEQLGFAPTYVEMTVRNRIPVTRDVLDRLSVYGIYGWSNDPDRAALATARYVALGAAGLLTMLVVGIAVAMSAAESRDEVATLSAVGAAPRQRRGFGALHGVFLGLVGCLLGVGIGVPAGLAFAQLDGVPGVGMPWLTTGGTAVVVMLLSWAIGAVVTPTRVPLTRRAS